jgi:hypothetical protein
MTEFWHLSGGALVGRTELELTAAWPSGGTGSLEK